MQITTVSHRHCFKLPKGYISKIGVDEFHRQIDEVIAAVYAVGSVSSHFSRDKDGLWTVYFSTTHGDQFRFEELGERLDKYLEKNRLIPRK
jgi:hypothetical protein